VEPPWKSPIRKNEKIKDPRERDCDDRRWIELAQERVQLRFSSVVEPSSDATTSLRIRGPIKCVDFVYVQTNVLCLQCGKLIQ
jgi:hypothetical protein